MDPRFFVNKGPYKLEQIIDRTGASLNKLASSDSDMLLRGVCPMEAAGPGDITFLTNNKYAKLLSLSKASACFMAAENIHLLPDHMYGLISTNPYYSYALAMDMFYGPKYIDNSRSNDLIATSAQIGDNCIIGRGAIIGDDAIIGDGTIIEAGAVIQPGVVIGRNCRIGGNATLSYTIIGDNVVILSGAQIGQDGFGFATEKGKHKKIFHVGRVVIGSDVEVGAGTTIDRGVYHDTVIEDGVRIDNLVQIGHNVKISRGSVIVAQAGIAGSAKLGAYCVIGGQAGIAGHVTLGNQVQIAAQGGVISDLEDGSIMGGTPCVPMRQWHKQSVILKQLASGKIKL